MPLVIFFVCLLLLPFIEIAVFIAVGAELGIAETLGVTILSAIVGILIVRAQGLGHLRRLQDNLRSGVPPLFELIHGVLLVVAGFCLLIPGLVTDAVGLILLVPPVRTALGRWFMSAFGRGAPQRRDGRRTVIIEGEAWEADPDDTDDDPTRISYRRDDR